MAWQRKHKEKSLKGKLEHDRKLLNGKPSDINLQNFIAALEAQIHKMDNYRGQGAKLKARLHWAKEGNRGSKYFFNFLNYKHRKKHIGAL